MAQDYSKAENIREAESNFYDYLKNHVLFLFLLLLSFCIETMFPFHKFRRLFAVYVRSFAAQNHLCET